MNIFWNILMLRVLEAANTEHIVEIDPDNSDNTENILEYCENRKSQLTVIDPSPELDLEHVKSKYLGKVEIFRDGLAKLQQLKNIDVVLIEGKVADKVQDELSIIEENVNENFPTIFFHDLGVEPPEMDYEIGEEVSDTDGPYEKDVLSVVEEFIDTSSLNLNFEISDQNMVGILYLRDSKLDEIIKSNFEVYNKFENEKISLLNCLEQYKSDAECLERKVEDVRCEYEYKTNKYRSLTQRMFSKFPFLLMLRFLPKTGLKKILLNRKGYHAIKNEDLFDIGYYLNNYSDVKLSGNDPIVHYIYKGFNEGRNPNPTFDAEYYLEIHEDVRKSDINPLVHYALYGIKERKYPDIADRYKLRSSELMGAISFKASSFLITGFLAVIGDDSPREAVIKIDNEKYNVLCDEFRSDLKEKGINEGYHSFRLDVPPQFIDCKNHSVRLFDKITGEIVANFKSEFSQLKNYRDFSGYLENSMVCPVVYAPFREQDKRCFASMENVTHYLTDLLEDQEDLPLVSVIMPVYNSINTLKRAVDSVLNQTYENFELIIVDGGSDDGSFNEISKIKDNRVVVIQNSEFKRVYEARNLALTSVKGKYIAYLDPVNSWDDRYLSAMIGAFTELSKADAVYSGQLLFTEELEHPYAVRFGSLNRSLLDNRNYIDSNALCHTRDLYEKIGGFDESLDGYGDWEMVLKISNQAQLYSVPVLLSNSNSNPEVEINSNNSNLTHLRNKQAEYHNLRVNDSIQILKNKVSIVIPSYESLEDIQECLQSIFDLNAEWIEVIVVDNASSKPVTDYLSRVEAEKRIKLIKNHINYGFTYAVNQGISMAEKGNDILLMNNDAMLTPGSVEAMQRASYELPDCGIIVPQQVLPGDTKTINEHVPYANPNYECDVNLSWLFNNTINMPLFHAGKVVELNFAPFFCVYINREVLDASVGLDAEYGRHYRSDRIFCNYIRHVMNLKIYHIYDAKVYHKIQKSTEVLRERSQDDFDIMFNKNQWDDELANKFGYNKPKWDY